MNLLLREFRFRIGSAPGLAISFLLLAACGFSGWAGLRWRAEVSGDLERVRARVEDARRSWLAETAAPKSPYEGRPMRLKHLATLPPGPLSDFAFTRESLYPRAVTFSGWSNEAKLFTGHEIQAPTALAYGRLDLTLCGIVLLPLVLIVLGHGALTNERASGRLGLMLAQGISPLTLVALRVGLAAFVGWGLLLGASLVGCSAEEAPGRWGRFIAWLTGITVYVAVWSLALMAIATVASSAAVEAIMGLGLWTALVVVAPALSEGLASVVHPSPSQVAYLSRARFAEAEAKRDIESRLAAFMSGHREVKDGDVPEFYRAGYIANVSVREEVGPTWAALEASRLARARLLAWTEALSPVSGVYACLVGIAGSGPERAFVFQSSVRAGLADWHERISEAVVRKQRLSPESVEAFSPARFNEPETPLHPTAWASLLLIGLVAAEIARRNARLDRVDA